eukprot:7241964-Pyramimonas_sp.AAC.1
MMRCIVSVVRRQDGLVHRGSHSHDDLTPVGTVSRGWERAIPATPLVLCSSETMVVNQISFVTISPTKIVVLVRKARLVEAAAKA